MLDRDHLIDDDYADYIDQVILEAFEITKKSVEHLDQDVFLDYVESYERADIFEMGPDGLADQFLEFIYEKLP